MVERHNTHHTSTSRDLIRVAAKEMGWSRRLFGLEKDEFKKQGRRVVVCYDKEGQVTRTHGTERRGRSGVLAELRKGVV
jgi:hypothetical protein